ncbi:hypothetical protein CLV51_103644 [Chitinophaga niastensis]|uniref:Uncharacterized protein n=2 Tax=Chitinophaga niastensis TaxID=536980 RepID=A0A2P8HKC5_CHINA|nr:hypothetical protein CLV51_103644 [Chitinophaga niastensis]
MITRQLLGCLSFTLLFTAAYSEPDDIYFGNKSCAVINYREGIHANKDSLRIAARYEQQAHDLYNKGHFRQAVVQWKKLLRLQPTNAFAMFMLGKSYMGLGEEEKGAALCDKAMVPGFGKITTE